MTPVPHALSLSGRRRQRAAGERISELFEQHGRMVYGVCRLILRDPTDAEDAAQQTFLSAYRALLAGQEPRDPSAWLGTIARNECRARLRMRSTEPLALVTPQASGDETQREVGRRAEVEALCVALAELPPQQRDAIVLREFYGLSYAEVASALGISGAAVESLIFRSRRRLQDQLRPLRAAFGALTLPPTLHESLTQLLPGFGGAGAGAGVAVGVLAKVGSAPLAAKLAAATLALGTAGTVAELETGSHGRKPQRAPRPAGHVQKAASPAPAAFAFHHPTGLASATSGQEHSEPEHARPERSSGEGPGSGRDEQTQEEHRQQEDRGHTETRRNEPEHEHADTNEGSSGGDGGGGALPSDSSGSRESDDGGSSSLEPPSGSGSDSQPEGESSGLDSGR